MITNRLERRRKKTNKNSSPIKTFYNYIKTYQIQYTKPKKAKPLIIKKRQRLKPSKILVDNSVHIEVKNPFALFKEEFEKRKKARMIQELKDGYY